MTDDSTGHPAVSVYALGSLLSVSVSPRASANAIGYLPDGSLRVRVTAPPADGAANAAVLRLLAELLDIPRSRLAIVSGATGRRKRVAIANISPESLAQRLRRGLTQPR